MKLSKDDYDCLLAFKEQVDAASLILNAHIRYLYNKYKLSPLDKINIDTGEIGHADQSEVSSTNGELETNTNGKATERSEGSPEEVGSTSN